MDMSSLPQVPKMRLIVCADFSEFYQMVIKPFASKQINYSKFKDILERLK